MTRGRCARPRAAFPGGVNFRQASVSHAPMRPPSPSGLALLSLPVGLAMLLGSLSSAGANPVVFFVSPQGDDHWSGCRDAPNVIGTDGPFRNLPRARDAIRSLKAQNGGTLVDRVTLSGNTVVNNVFVDGSQGNLFVQPIDASMQGNVYFSNIIVYQEPTARCWYAPGWRRSALEYVDNNLYWHTGGLDFTASSLFSPAYDMGFQDIPVDRIGPEGFLNLGESLPAGESSRPHHCPPRESDELSTLESAACSATRAASSVMISSG